MRVAPGRGSKHAPGAPIPAMKKPTPAEREARVRALIRERGLSLERHGRAWRIYGLNVDLLTRDLALLDERDLRPERARVW